MCAAPRCPACKGRGLLYPAVPACQIKGLRRRWSVLEKCDTCDRFSDDLEAALSRFAVAGWFKCDNGGEHALADTRTALHGR